MQGHSLVPLLEDGGQAVRSHVLVEDDVAPIVARRTPIPGKTRTLITERYRYTRNSKGEEQLFDLQADPDEMTDLARRDPALRASLLEQLTDALLAADDAARNTPVRG
jgi:arylsulfatase A-like enzyme